MKVYEFGDPDKPILLLLPGTCCHWKANFGDVVPLLQKRFYIACVSYDGFDETEQTEFVSMMDETKKIEAYVWSHYGGRIHAAYGCSLGGSFVGLLLSRKKITMKHGIIGSSDLDQAGWLAAKLQTKLALPILYRLIHKGGFANKHISRFMEKRIAEMGAYGEAMKRMFGIGTGTLRIVSKASIENQFFWDLRTPLPEDISVPGTTVHVFYALKMGEKYLARYNRHFHKPDIVAFDLRHEELLAVYPEKWVDCVEKVCLREAA
ncbi:MAG TPA: alpha/beta hydrolase [Clostridia bacterium]|nr:alpha/beta hydrolase [Clostridia bacterium]